MSKSEQLPAAPPTMSPAQQMLIDFLRDHDAACPVCGYNVRALTRPICPECRHELVLTVGTAKLGIGWLLVAVAPGFFSGISAVFVLVPILGQLLLGNGGVEPLIVALDLFGWCSAFFAIFLAAKPKRFIAQPRARQRLWVIMIWIVHIAALGLFILLGTVFF